MKKIGYLFACLLCVLLTGCSLTKQEQTVETKEEKADIIVGVEKDNAPYYSEDAGGNAKGIYVDFMNAIKAKSGLTYEFKEMNTAEAASGEEESADVFLGTLEKESGVMADIPQSGALWQSSLCVAVKQGSAATSMKDLENVSIAARANTGESAFAKYLAAKYNGEAIVFQDLSAAAGDLETGYSKAAVIDAGNFSVLKQSGSAWKVLKTSEKFFNTHRFTALNGKQVPETLMEAVAQVLSDGVVQELLQKYGL